MASPWKGFLEEGKYGLRVGVRRKSVNDGSDWYTPEATIWATDEFVHIQTDPYEGHAMLNIEALPYLIRALRQIKKEA